MAYLLSPLDLSPDIIPIAGQIDDVILVSLLVAEVSQIVMDFFQKRRQTQGAKSDGPEVTQTVDVNVMQTEE